MPPPFTLKGHCAWTHGYMDNQILFWVHSKNTIFTLYSCIDQFHGCIDKFFSLYSCIDQFYSCIDRFFSFGSTYKFKPPIPPPLPMMTSKSFSGNLSNTSLYHPIVSLQVPLIKCLLNTFNNNFRKK